MKPDITAAKAIDGWMAESELLWLAERAAEHRCIVEIGSHLGRSTRAMLDNTSGVVYAFDNWNGPMDVYMEKEEREQIYSQFLANTVDHIAAGKCIPVRGYFNEDKRSDLFPDMVFIDGGHDYQEVYDDIHRWLPRIAADGLICGHDYISGYQGVRQAVDDVFEDVKVIKDGSIWYKVL